MSSALAFILFTLDRVRTMMLALSLIVLAKIAVIIIAPVAG